MDWIFIVPVALFAFASISLTDATERDRAWYGLLPPALGMTVSALLFSAWVEVIVKTLLYFSFFGFSIWLALRVARLFREHAAVDNVHFKKLRRDVRALAGIWAVYNLTLLLGSDGLRFLLPSVTTANFENLDFAVAVAYPFFALARVGRSAEAEGWMRHQARTDDEGPGVILRRAPVRSR